MPARRVLIGWMTFGVCVTSVASLLAAPRKSRPNAASVNPPSATAMSPEEARRSVAMLDDAYQEILHAIHNWYPTKTGQPVVAATTVIELQKIMAQKGWPQSRFLAVNAIVMNPEHLARDGFEKEAAAALKQGQNRFERVEKGQLRVATVLPTGGGCFSCHWTDSRIGSRAAITWRVPLKPAP